MHEKNLKIFAFIYQFFFSKLYISSLVVHIIRINWTSLVAQWLRICLPMQGTWVQALVPEDPHMPWSN